MRKKLTKNDVIEKIKKYDIEYDYSQMVYINSATKIKLTCVKHNICFTIRPNDIISRGTYGCKICSIEHKKKTNLERHGVENVFANKEIQEKIKKTNLDKYGVTSPIQNKDIKDKIKKTNLERYGVEYVIKNKEIYGKIRQTNLDRFGCEYASQNKEIKEKQRKTNIERYGVNSPTQNKEIYAKAKKTMVERHGVNSPTQNKEIYNKIKQTNLERYGVENPQQNKEIQEKTKQTNIKRYGGGHKLPHMYAILPLINDYDWLFEQYITLNKTAEQIARELNIGASTLGRYLKQNEIEIKYTTGYSMKAIQWLEEIMSKEGIFIQHAMNGGEYLIPGTRYKVDGYCAGTNTIYEFHGNRFHGNPDLFEDNDKPNFYNPEITAKELYTKTKKREQEMINLGYNLITIWENNYSVIEEKLDK